MARSLTRSLMKGLVWMALAFAGVGFLVSHQGQAPESLQAPTASYAQSVVAASGCVAPAAGVLPSGAVLTLQTDVAARYTTNPRLVGLALAHALEGADNRVYSVTAFCA